MNDDACTLNTIPTGPSWVVDGLTSNGRGLAGPGTILVVDDSAISRQIVVEVLSEHGHRTYEADHGANAVQVLNRHKDIELIVCDLEMPVMDGMALIGTLAGEADLSRIPVIIISTVDEMDRMVSCLENGAVDFIRKPFHSSHLLVRVRNTLILSRTIRHLKSLAHRDPLTGVYNLRVFEEMLNRDLALGSRRQKSVGMIMADLDHFKRVNDTHGHQVGDEVLQAFSMRCREAIRGGDLLARYGGEEFAVIVADVDSDTLVDVAERVRLSMTVPVATSAGEVLVTVSLGAALSEPGSEETAYQLIGRSDQALYRAKDQGRNQVVLHDW